MCFEGVRHLLTHRSHLLILSSQWPLSAVELYIILTRPSEKKFRKVFDPNRGAQDTREDPAATVFDPKN